jgi:hypothetical protein
LYSRKQKDRQQSTSRIVLFWFLSVKSPLCGISVISRDQKLLDKNELSLLPVPRVLWSSWCCLSPLPRSSEIRDAVGTYRVSVRTWFCSLEEGAARAALRALQLGLGLGYVLDSWCARSEVLFRDHTTDAACGASSEREPRCRSAVSILAYRTISFPGHFLVLFFFEREFFWISFQGVVEVLMHLLGLLRARSVCFSYIRLPWVPSLAQRWIWNTSSGNVV